VEVLDAEGRVIEPFSAQRAIAITGDSTQHHVRWVGNPSLHTLSGEIVRFRFSVSRGRIYAFWVSASEGGQSNGFVAAGGPAYRGSRDSE
jgi:hypothetical protein